MMLERVFAGMERMDRLCSGTGILVTHGRDPMVATA